jgi:hypothetical protein
MRALAVVIVALVAALVGGPASAGTPAYLNENCIGNSEYGHLTRATLGDIERSVDAVGTTVVAQHHGRSIVRQYRWCGHYTSEGYAQISYDRNRAGRYMSAYAMLFVYPLGPLQHHPNSSESWKGRP